MRRIWQDAMSAETTSESSWDGRTKEPIRGLIGASAHALGPFVFYKTYYFLLTLSPITSSTRP
jgi:hypothetical protein